MSPFIYPIPGNANSPAYETRFGSGTPTGSLGNVGDVYIDTITKNIYKKTSPSTWTLQTSASIIVKDENNLIESNTVELNFVGIDVLAENSAPGIVKINIPTPPPPAYAYFSGGYNSGGNVSTTNRLDFSNDTAAMLIRGSLTSAISSTSGNNSSTKGYFAKEYSGGHNVAALIFSSDTSAMTNTTSFSPPGSIWGTASANSTSTGYWAGYHTGGHVGSTANFGLNFASDTTPLVAKGSLTAPRHSLAGANSSTSAYFAGGDSLPSIYNSTDKLIFSSDTTTMSSAGTLVSAKEKLSGANSTSAAYFAGGSTTLYGSGTNSCYKLSFASDTTTMSSVGTLTTNQTGMTGANSPSKAYFSGGANTLSGTPIYYSTTNSLTFATDTSTMTTLASLSIARAELGSCQSGGIL